MKILPCPFCGLMPKIETYFRRVPELGEELDGVQARVKIQCNGCYLRKDVGLKQLIRWDTPQRENRKIRKQMVEKIISEIWNWRQYPPATWGPLCRITPTKEE